MKLFVSIFLMAAIAVAADLPGFKVYKADEIKTMTQSLTKKIDGNRFASDRLDNFGSHYTMLAHRQGNGQAEVHATENDLFVVESGEATLIVGGTVKGLHTVSPGEGRGTGLEGGERKRLTAGDIVHIPAKMPHQLLIDQGKEFTYFVMKTK